MCGRFTLRTPLNRLVERFLFELQDDPLPPRFNIAPSQPVAAVRQVDASAPRQLAMLRWGLIPSWSKDPSIAYKLINARSETVAEKPSFRSAFKQRRCLILSDGYYEWQKVSSKKKQPYYIRLKDDTPFAFAGLWETWQQPDGTPLETCTIITTEANDLTSPIHPRMPVILDSSTYEAWLSASSDEAENLKGCLQMYPAEAMDVFPVSTLVNSPKNESAECITRLEDGGDSTGPRQLSFF